MQAKLPAFLFILISITLFVSCATFNNSYVKDERNWKTDNVRPDSLELVHTVYLLGDAGESPEGDIKPAIKYFNKVLKTAPKNSSAIILGDNIYFTGMPKEEMIEERKEAEHDLAVQLDGLLETNFAGKPVIIMGNHDWGQDDPIKGVKRQADFIDEYLDRDDDVVFPKPGCGDPTTVELSEDLVVICIDSQWWIEDWDKLPEINDGCEVNTRALFMTYFEDQLTDHKGKNIIVALHHPPFTNGSHGGEFTLASHIFPLRQINKNLWLPIPLLGTIVNATRASVGTDTDRSDPRYTGLANGIIEIAERHDSVIFVSGHEHSLQYFEVDNQTYIVSGSGAKKTAARAGNGALFTTGQYGHVVLYTYEDGSVWTEFFTASSDGETGTLVYRKKVKDGLPAVEEKNENIVIEEDTREYPSFGKTHITSVYPDSIRMNLNRAILGKFNSELYFTDIEAPVLMLDEYEGGLEILQPGGSKQTVSLRMQDKNGRTYNLRSLRKDPTRSLPDVVNFPLSQRLMQYFFTGANPFGAFAVPDLAEAANVYHTTPQLFYLPPQKALGRFNDKFADQLYMLEERPDETWADTGKFGPGTTDVSYRKLFEEIRSEDDKIVKVNQPLALRNRLLDILIGDFDRHLDQFRFWERETQDSFYYDPVPRDRDVAFSNWDGLAYRTGKLLDPFLRATHNYDDDIDDMKWLIFQSRGFDDNFLNELTWEDWEREAKTIQQNLTDDVIEKALRKMPKEIFDKQGASIRHALKARRDDLMKYTREYYELMSKVVEIIGTDDNDVFEVVRKEGGITEVTGWTANKKGEKKKQIYNRVFDPEFTQEIRIYGLDNEDFFFVMGEAKKGIKVRLIGGYEEDTFTDTSKIRGLNRNTVIHDIKDGNNIVNGSSETKDAQSSLTLQNSLLYLKEELHFDYTVPFLDGGFNPDDGALLGLKLDYFTFPYRKKNVQSLSVKYAFATQAVSFGYRGDFSNIFNNKWDLLVNAEVFGPQFTRNYFGFGNDTRLVVPEGTEEGNLDFNRTRLSKYSIRPSLKREFFKKNYFSIGLIGEAIKVEKTENRIFDTDLTDVNSDVFKLNYFAGIEGNLVFDFVDDAFNPANGIRFRLNADWRANVQDVGVNYANLGTSFTFYNGWGEPRRLVLASKVGYSQNIGDYYFYQGVTLGGQNNLRGYRRDRFTGDSYFFHNTDLRLRLFSSTNNFIPFSFGVLGGFDYGKVYEEDVDSDTWHYGYGGGVWISPADAVILNASYFMSPEDARFTFQLGYLF